MDLKWLRYLQAIIDTGSFAAAAQLVGVSQPAITKAMQGLERKLGVVLFVKVGRKKLATPAAVLAAQRTAELQGRINDLVRMPSSPQEDAVAQGHATLKVGMAPAAALLYGPAIERVWRTYEPEGLFQIFVANVPEMLASLHSKQLDFVIAPQPRRHHSAGLQRHLLHTSTPTIFARVGHPLAGATSLTEIAQANWAVAGHAGTAGRVIEEAHRVRRLAAPKIMVQCADYPALLNLVAQSDLLCVVPHPLLMPAKQGKDLRPLLIREGLPKYDVCIFWPLKQKGRHAIVVDAVFQALKLLADSSDGP